MRLLELQHLRSTLYVCRPRDKLIGKLQLERQVLFCDVTRFLPEPLKLCFERQDQKRLLFDLRAVSVGVIITRSNQPRRGT